MAHLIELEIEGVVHVLELEVEAAGQAETRQRSERE